LQNENWVYDCCTHQISLSHTLSIKQKTTDFFRKAVFDIFDDFYQLKINIK